MGLYMRSYEHAELIKRVESVSEDFGEYEDDDDMVFVYLHGGEFERTESGLVTGWYKTTGESVGWRAGSYGGYNLFRVMLASMFHKNPEHDYWPDDADQRLPFFELINYSDCEGTMSPAAIQSVYMDFVEHRPLFADMYPDDSPYGWLPVYDKWINGLKIANNPTGLVVFH